MSARLAVGGLRTDGFGLSSPFVELIATPDELTFRGRFGLSHVLFRTRHIGRDRVMAIAPASQGQLGGTGIVIRGSEGERWIFFGMFEQGHLENRLLALGYPVESA